MSLSKFPPLSNGGDDGTCLRGLLCQLSAQMLNTVPGTWRKMWSIVLGLGFWRLHAIGSASELLAAYRALQSGRGLGRH